ncbi:MAG: neutral/alkaline non-lysosomal ceramidase N-terminal domain-containing protein [Bacteroidota bacterium]
MGKKWLKILGVTISILILIGLTLISTVDRTPYQKMPYYEKTIDAFSALQPTITTGDTLKVGWSRVSLVPEETVPLSGYGKRRGAHYSGIHDSVYVRAFVFDNGLSKATYVSADLLIVPPLVYERIFELLDSEDFNPDNTFLTATHSHSSIGGWQPGIVGRLFSGEFDLDMVEFIAQQIATAIEGASEETSQAQIGYSAVMAADLVRNRLVGDQVGQIDPWFRIIKIIKDNGEVGLLTSFAAHATCTGGSFMELSADYPGLMVKMLEADSTIDFASYGAGAVGSMAPLAPRLDDLEEIKYIASNLVPQIMLIQNATPTDYTTELGFAREKVELRVPHFRISENLRLRPWVFEQVFGEVEATVNALKIGDQLLIGTPADFSGELIEPLSNLARTQGHHLMVHSFNGSYMGYVTKDEWYDLDKYETRTMNWFGPYNGDYFSELISVLITKFSVE